MNNCKKLLAISFGLLAILNSCKDNTGTLGPNVLPKSDIISAYQTDTSKVITSMFLKNSVPTNQVYNCMLGNYNDPVFGETKASIYVEVCPSTLPAPPWEANSSVDSAVLWIQLASAPYYGSSDPQTFTVYQTDSTVLSPHAYYSDTNLKYNPSPIGVKQVTLPDAESSYDTLRIKLNKNWCTNFANNLEFNGNWSANFSSLIKGLYITTSNPLQLPGQGGLLNTSMLEGAFSGIYVFYHSTIITPDTEKYAIFPLGGSGEAYFVHFDHNYATTVFGGAGAHPIGKHDSIGADQLMYVQSLGGVLGRINFPNLYKYWSKLGPIIVNEAVITLPVEPQSAQTLYTAEATSGPGNLNLLGTDSAWGMYGLPDLLSQNVAISNNSYSFVVTQYIQSVINGKTIDRGLYVLPNSYASTANGVVLYGAKHGTLPANKATLTIYYTPVKSH